MRLATDAREAGAVEVWDPIVRIFHWTLVASFFGAFLIERPRDLHEALGYLALGAVAVRLVWGVIGTKHARFADFVTGPRRLIGYVGDVVHSRERRHLGHNPAGAAMILALMAMVIVIGASGWMMGSDAWFGEEWVEGLHESAVNVTLGLVALHVAGVVWESVRNGENLVRAMITGRKRR